MKSLRKFAWAMVALTLAFAKPLFDLIRFALDSDTFSHIILIPFISGYLASLRRHTLVLQGVSWPALIPSGLGALLLGMTWFMPADTRLTFYILAFVCFVLAAGFFFLGATAVRTLAFPFGLLFFMAPFPPVMLDALEAFFQHTSAAAAAAMIKLSGLPAFQKGLYFYLPGLAIEVAKECSGIRSTLVLFITSLVAGHLILRNPRHRAILAIAVIPLAILRNGFRIFSLAWLSVEVNPNIIDSALHHRGGPIFFALSLIPFFLLLLLLRKFERKPAHAS